MRNRGKREQANTNPVCANCQEGELRRRGTKLKCTECGTAIEAPESLGGAPSKRPRPRMRRQDHQLTGAHIRVAGAPGYWQH